MDTTERIVKVGKPTTYMEDFSILQVVVLLQCPSKGASWGGGPCFLLFCVTSVYLGYSPKIHEDA